MRNSFTMALSDVRASIGGMGIKLEIEEGSIRKLREDRSSWDEEIDLYRYAFIHLPFPSVRQWLRLECGNSLCCVT